MAKTATTAATTTTGTSAKARRASGRLRWHPARLLYIFVVTLVVGILYSEVQALLADPSSALNPSQLQGTFFWHLALAYPDYFAAACFLAVGAAVLGWRAERRYAAAQAETQREETVVAVLERAQSAGQSLGARRAVPRDLPPRAPGFVGRRQDLGEIGAALRQGQAVAVVGMGGLGKSTLAAEMVYALAADPTPFPRGVTWMRCDERTGLEGAIWVEDQVLAAWNVSLPPEATARAKTPEEGLELREQALRKRFGALDSGSQALVLLDNVEPDLPLARLLDTLAPLGIAVLVTTRVEPSSQHIRLLTLDVLDPDAGVRLFAERYADRGGKWDAVRDQTATAQIVEALGGLPLAIELAAARGARTRISLALLAEELRAPDALAKLNNPRDPSSGVRYSLRKTLLALTPSQRARFAALGLPEGPDWALPIIERMFEGVPTDQAGVTSARDDLEALVAYSLAGLSTPEGSETPRVRLHPLVRELAREEWAQLPQAEQEASLQALLAGVRDWVAWHQTVNADTYRALALDEDLMAGALRAAVGRHLALPQVISIITAWRPNLQARSLLLLSQMSLLQLESARALGDRGAELNALGQLGSASRYLGRVDESDRYHREALTLARKLGDQTSVVKLLAVIVDGIDKEDSSADVEQMYDEASAIAVKVGDQLTDWSTLNGLGVIAFRSGHMEEARQWYQRALERAQVAGDHLQEAQTLMNLGFLAEEIGDVPAAHHAYESTLAVGRSFGVEYYYVTGVALNALGQLALRGGDLETAGRYLTEALPQFEEAETTGAGMALHVRGNLALLSGIKAQRRGERAEVAQAFKEGLRLFDEAGNVGAAMDQRPFARKLLAELQGGTT